MELDATQLPSLNTPYFVHIEKLEKKFIFNFHYDEDTTRFSVVDYEPFHGVLGELSGRFFP